MHTPGPWKATISDSDEHGFKAWKIEPHIAQIFYVNVAGEANARLIAAAPRLLAACELYIATYDETRHNPTVEEEAACINAMRAAVAEVKGREP